MKDKIFPLNTIILNKNDNQITFQKLIMLMGVYYVAALVIFEVMYLFALLPFLKELFFFVDWVANIYCFSGMVLGIYEYLNQNRKELLERK